MSDAPRNLSRRLVRWWERCAIQADGELAQQLDVLLAVWRAPHRGQ